MENWLECIERIVAARDVALPSALAYPSSALLPNPMRIIPPDIVCVGATTNRHRQNQQSRSDETEHSQRMRMLPSLAVFFLLHANQMTNESRATKTNEIAMAAFSPAFKPRDDPPTTGAVGPAATEVAVSLTVTVEPDKVW